MLPPDAFDMQSRPRSAALRGLAEARESEQAGDVVYGAEAERALLAERRR